MKSTRCSVVLALVRQVVLSKFFEREVLASSISSSVGSVVCHHTRFLEAVSVFGRALRERCFVLFFVRSIFPVVSSFFMRRVIALAPRLNCHSFCAS